MDRRVWIGLGAALVAATCCVCGILGSALQGLGRAGQEVAWLGAAGDAVRNATQPRADEMLVLRRLQAGEPIGASNLAELEAVCRTMAARTRSEWASVEARPLPPRFTALRDLGRRGAAELEGRWTRLAEGIRTRNLDDLRRNLAETQAFGDRFREEVEAELKRLYPPAKG